MNTSYQPTVNLVQDARSAHALLNPIRLQILQRLRKPNSASGLARAMDLPRQKINYHLRELEKKGLVEQVEERRKGNCVERIVRATAKSYIINPEALGALATNPEKVRDKFSSSYLLAVAVQLIREVALLRERADKAKKRLPTFTLQTKVRFASAADLNAFTEELTNTVADLAAKYHDEKAGGGRLFRFIVGAYPAITKGKEG
ncbi:helix-turn-helix transcriptional regulator [candidate division KSB1 bacterium]|nr:helix-turn-helix transcriptional regulator [candidate division KSB1 bacterium]NIR72306.1 helix-turn-helix transcriptional regulator [candidate division KSB1 bacterium]NIS26698.1 helix-turn-helix transcriptional regulator [candidate division KSB1 bacterium]NIT70334.1 helix-turn-helix transcriptional regulator [candidate division KSB1 bacterium]NIU27313.1 helix-turn-helix transcriptional regulator [candidate division KSB1 bacterium]